MSRREVRVADSFFARLDEQLGEERGPEGEPSSTDFLVIDLPRIVERFATQFDRLPSGSGGVDSVRMVIGTGALVRAFVVFGVEVAEGVVELIDVELDVGT